MIYNLRNIIDHDLGIKGENFYVPLDTVTDTMNKLVALNEGEGLVAYYSAMQEELTNLSLKVSSEIKDVTDTQGIVEATTAITVPNAKAKALRIQGVPVALVDSTMYVHHDFVYISLVLSSRLFIRLHLDEDVEKLSYKRASREVADIMYTEVVRSMRVQEDLDKLEASGEDGLFDPVLSFPKRTFLDHDSTTKYSLEGMTPEEIEQFHEGKNIVDLDEHIVVDENDNEVFGFNIYHTDLSILVPCSDGSTIRANIMEIPLNSDLIISDEMDTDEELPDDILYILDSTDSGREVLGEITVDMSPDGFSDMVFSTMPEKVYQEVQDYLMLVSILTDATDEYNDKVLEIAYNDIHKPVEEFRKARAEVDNTPNNDMEDL